jgi:transcriptional regulator with XRE-family HTH domain
LTFQDAQERLLGYVRERIHNGELTERGFARMIGLSQPHVHNVLKGVRNLSVEISDLILKTLHITLLDLASIPELQDNLKRKKHLEPVLELPILPARIGPGRPYPAGITWGDRFPAPFEGPSMSPTLTMARFDSDPEMSAILGHCDIAVLDLSERQRYEPSPEGLYVIERGEEAAFRYIRPGASCFYLLTDTTLENPEQWESLDIPSSELLRFVKARVVWLGREKDRDLPMAQRGRFLCEVISS